MYMVGMLQIQAYRATKQIKYADRAAISGCGLLEKTSAIERPVLSRPGFSLSLGTWKRMGRSVDAELLKSLPPDHKLRPEIMAGYKKMLSSLLKYQSDNGMWKTVD